jgi:glutathione S-transferase
MQLIGQFDSPFVRRVGIALVRYAMPFEHLPYSTFGEGGRFHHLNPLKRVPTLVLDDGEALMGSDAILDHLDETQGRERALIAASGAARRAALKRCALATGTSEKAVGFFYARLFASQLDPAFVARSEAQIRDGLAALDRACAQRQGDWWFGIEPGHDDIAAACTTRHACEAYPALLRLADYPALARHCARAELRPEFQSITQVFIPPE